MGENGSPTVYSNHRIPKNDPRALGSEHFGFLQQYNSTTASAVSGRSLRANQIHPSRNIHTRANRKESHGKWTWLSYKSTNLQNTANAAELASSALTTTVLQDMQRNLVNRIRQREQNISTIIVDNTYKRQCQCLPHFKTICPRWSGRSGVLRPQWPENLRLFA